MSKEKFNSEESASKLEAKARQLRESGLSREDLDMVAGGEGYCPCCGSSCTEYTTGCGDFSDRRGSVYHHPEDCKRSCIASSPD